MAHHHHDDYIEVVSSQGPAQLSGKWTGIFAAMTVIGFGAFAAFAFAGDQTRIGWIAYLHNLYFFTGLAAGLVVTAAIMQVARSHWGRAIKRFAEAAGGFLWVALGLSLLLYIGADHIYEWAETPPDPVYYTNKHFWLTKNFWFIRVVGAIAALAVVAHFFRQTSLRPDLGYASELNPDKWSAPSGWAGKDTEVEKCYDSQSYWGVIYCITYACAISLLAYDLIMSLDYRWFSTMFGGWHFTSFILISWGSLVFLSWWLGDAFGLAKYIHKMTYHDLGKLTFGFTVVWGYLFFAQYQVIWYGNLPHETGYLLTRFYEQPWRPITLTVFAMCFLIPFIIGLSKDIKLSPKTFAPVVVISFLGLWLERFILIAPASWYYDRHAQVFEGGVEMLLMVDAVVAIGFAGLFGLVYTRTLFKSPLMVISDPRLDEGVNRH